MGGPLRVIECRKDAAVIDEIPGAYKTMKWCGVLDSNQ
jgi:hypothetical protein